MHDLNERAADLATGSEVVFVVEEGGDALYFSGQGGSDFKFAKNHSGGSGAAPRCQRIVVEDGFHVSQPEMKQGDLFRIFSGTKVQQGILF